MTLMMPLMMLVMNVATVAIVWFGSHGVAAGAMQAGDMMAFISYAMMIVMSFLVVSMVAVILPRAEVSVGRVQEVLDVTPAVREPKNPVAPAEDAPSGRLVFDHVGFHYPDAEGNVVSDVSFATMPGKVTAIVGSTGSGKSTLVQLVPRLYDPGRHHYARRRGLPQDVPRRPALARGLRAPAGLSLLRHHRQQRGLWHRWRQREGPAPRHRRGAGHGTCDRGRKTASKRQSPRVAPTSLAGSAIRPARARALAASRSLVLGDSFSAA